MCLTNDNHDIIYVNVTSSLLCNGYRHLCLQKQYYRTFCVQGDIGDEKLVRSIFADYSIDTILHFAAQSNVGQLFVKVSYSVEYGKDFNEQNHFNTLYINLVAITAETVTEGRNSYAVGLVVVIGDNN